MEVSVGFTRRPLYPLLVGLEAGGAPQPVCEWWYISFPCGESNPDHPVLSPSLCLLSYPGSIFMSVSCLTPDEPSPDGAEVNGGIATQAYEPARRKCSLDGVSEVYVV
jgi:hypothetical protein